MAEFEVILKKHGLRKTTFRKELLSMFYESNSSLTAEEIKNKLKGSSDKVTIYRALEAFEKTGLIHRVPDKSNLTRYAICLSECSSIRHVHNHAHFICNKCNETFCINDVEIPVIESTKGFLIQNSKLTLEGECPKCLDI
jgi:Fur family transcriptional regulator, ferric uptake regulator